MGIQGFSTSAWAFPKNMIKELCTKFAKDASKIDGFLYLRTADLLSRELICQNLEHMLLAALGLWLKKYCHHKILA